MTSRPAFLQAVEDRLHRAVEDRDDGTPGLLREAARTLVLAPGAKRLRPRLAMMLAADLGAPAAGVVRAAAAAELMHAASLLHDDVVDEGRLRRGLPTANARWGNAPAVLAGDWLLTQAFQELVGLPSGLIATAIPAVAEMTRAAILEIETRGRADQTLEAWRRIAEGKTGVLFAWCATAGAVLADREDAAPALDAFGRHLGVAFQAADDLRDVCDGTLGKDRFSDIRSKTPSSVLVLAMRSAPALRARIEAARTAPELPDALVEELGAVVAEDGTAAARALVAGDLAEARSALRRAAPSVGDGWAPELVRFGEQFLRGLGV